MAAGFVLGFLLLMVVFILSLLDKTKSVSDDLRWPFRLVPMYCIGEGVINLNKYKQMKAAGLVAFAFDGDVTDHPIAFLSVEVPVFFFGLLLILIDHPRRRTWWERVSYRRGRHNIEEMDTDVEDERNAVYDSTKGGVVEGVVTVCDLRKEYPNGKVAVRNLTLDILPGEGFGLLGTNGAGKTTTISILCQEFLPTGGSAYVCGYDVVEESAAALQYVGYYPQFDASLDFLTVEEHLRLCAGLCCIAESQHDEGVSGRLRLCGLVEYRSTLAHELSRGDRRKRSVTMALVCGLPGGTAVPRFGISCEPLDLFNVASFGCSISCNGEASVVETRKGFFWNASSHFWSVCLDRPSGKVEPCEIFNSIPFVFVKVWAWFL
ncbi:ABCA1 transporter [Trypanosoma rangeli]|uniref:ABCA1 transporter n=1 Tax=Trypanosoma rangeli TaxID=5698 RepID=A0A3R7NL26_TRYRA|nr:ABCA1 transporter [Trypanosoma rangeli]RNF08065.1 ABCA1 transporter [Trypanosoma rangeli]|eukprot:RNF08065.1 ABCA1 transporter [Trypanosoma rangeli]